MHFVLKQNGHFPFLVLETSLRYFLCVAVLLPVQDVFGQQVRENRRTKGNQPRLRPQEDVLVFSCHDTGEFLSVLTTLATNRRWRWSHEATCGLFISVQGLFVQGGVGFGAVGSPEGEQQTSRSSAEHQGADGSREIHRSSEDSRGEHARREHGHRRSEILVARPPWSRGSHQQALVSECLLSSVSSVNPRITWLSGGHNLVPVACVQFLCL